MAQPLTRRYRGFSPAEISALINEFVVLEHCEEAAAKWRTRFEAVDLPHYDLADLAQLDAKLEANLIALGRELAGARGRELALEQFETLEGVEEAFVATFLAARDADQDGLELVFAALDEEPALAPGVSSALGWSQWDVAWSVIDPLWRSGAPQRRRVALGAMTQHQRDATSYIAELTVKSEPILLKRAARAMGELGLVKLGPALRPLLGHEDRELRYWVAWAMLLLGARDDQVSLALSSLAERPGVRDREAAAMLMRALPEPVAQTWFSRLMAVSPEHRLVAVHGAGAGGHVKLLESLLGLLDGADEVLARTIGAAFSLAFGVDLEREDLDADPPAPEAEAEAEAGAEAETDIELEDKQDALDDELDELEKIGPLPDPERLRAWWAEHRGRFGERARYLAGLPIRAQNLATIVARGTQPQRHAAAIEAALAEPSAPVYRTRMSGVVQARELLGWA